MTELLLHHVSLVVTDLDKSVSFYSRMFGLQQIERPRLGVPGAWLACGRLQVHLIVHPTGTFRDRRGIDTSDVHFAFRTDSYDSLYAELREKGYGEDLPAGDPKQLVVRPGIAGYPQLYLLDPDQNIIEINAAPA